MMDFKSKNELAAALRRIVWGYILIHLDIHIIWLNILPDWIGYGLFLTAIDRLAKHTPSVSLLESFGFLLMGWNLISWIWTILGGAELLPVFAAVFSIISIYFHFQLLTNLAEASELTSCGRPTSIRNLRTYNVLLTTFLSFPLPEDLVDWLAVMLTLVEVGFITQLVIVLNGMKSELLTH